MMKIIQFVVMFAVAIASSTGVTSLPFYKEIAEGYVGVQYWFGARQPTLLEKPGAYFDFWNHEVRAVEVDRWQIDRVDGVICATTHGERVTLDIRVENMLLNKGNCVFRTISTHTEDYDQKVFKNHIQTEVAQFCKDYTLADFVLRQFDKVDDVLTEKLQANVEKYGLSDCLLINKVHIDPPKMSKEMQAKFSETALEQQEQELQKQKKETERIQHEAELQKTTAEQDRKIMVASKTAEEQHITDEMLQSTVKMQADGELYAQQKAADAIKAQIAAHGGPETYLTSKQIEAHRDSRNKELHFYGDSANLPRTVYNIGSNIAAPSSASATDSCPTMTTQL
jgi:hypothetical protein